VAYVWGWTNTMTYVDIDVDTQQKSTQTRSSKLAMLPTYEATRHRVMRTTVALHPEFLLKVIAFGPTKSREWMHDILYVT
jgi:hypothetical protein